MDESGFVEYELFSPVLATKWIIERDFIWQMRFLTEQELYRHANERGLGFSTSQHIVIKRLWQLGLLRADYVISQCPLTTDGLTWVHQDDGGDYIYADRRGCVRNAEGLGGMMRELPDLSPSIHLRFHPFRYYVLCEIEKMLQMRIGIAYVLSNPEGLIQAVNRYIHSFNSQTSSEQFNRKVCRWNEVVSLAVSAEPFTYGKLFGVYAVPLMDDKNSQVTFYREMENQRANCKNILEEIGTDKIKQVLSALCREAESLEPNTDIRHILRFTADRYRIERVKGKLGGAILLLTMAEMIRRAAEMAFDIEIPEEDELGSSWDAGSLKVDDYGTQRLNDDYKAKATFIRGLGLDYHVRLRWYVEGVSELGALDYLLEGYTKIETVDLKGQVIAKLTKGVSFREELSKDIQRSVYSWISLDGDVKNNVKVVKKAAEDGVMFGQFFISVPDFEVHNFSSEELAEVFWEMASEDDPALDQEDRERLFRETTGAETAKLFDASAKRALQKAGKIGKGKEWGERLGKYAERNPFRQLPDGTNEYRPVIKAVRQALHVIQCDYYSSLRDYCISPTTGEMVERFPNSAT